MSESRREPEIVEGEPGQEPVGSNNLAFDPFADHSSQVREQPRGGLRGKADIYTRRILGLPPKADSHRDRVTRGESIAQSFSAATYVEEDPTVPQWIREHIWTRGEAWSFCKSLFPFTSWILRYNTTWLYGDLVAGITVGAVVVPQGMAYAKLATLPVQYGLYSSFMGVMIYWLFATSRDITIGPVAVMSQLMGNIIAHAQEYDRSLDPVNIATSLAVLCGCIIFFLGITRLGFIVEFIPLPAIASFMTGSAINIIAGQVPTVMGTSKLFNTRAPTYWVIIHTLQKLPDTTLDAAMGLTALFLLYLLRFVFQQLGKRDRPRARLWFFLSTLRTAFVILLYTLISWLCNMNERNPPRFSILGTVPRGFQHAGAPPLSANMIRSFASDIPSAVIVLLIEHIAISKSFGRVGGYTINPSQELIAIGITNIFGPFIGAYPATGSFSRTAIKAKAGVKTPLAGIITGIVVLLAIFALTKVFYYIPQASLAAVIIHAVGDLIVHPRVVYGFWLASPLEVIIFLAGVLVTVFSSIENGIYVTICLSAGLLLFRIAKANGQFLGRAKVRSIDGQDSHNVYLPLDHGDGTNPDLPIDSPAPGVFIYRFTDGLVYPNASHYTDKMVEYIVARTKRHPSAPIIRNNDRPWNDPVPRNFDAAAAAANDPRPTLKAIICDFSAVNEIDVTSLQILVDVRNHLDRLASPDQVAWHFAAIRSPWVKRALASVGFGQAIGVGKPIFSISDVASSQPSGRRDDAEAKVQGRSGVVPVSSLDRPWMHVDTDSAVEAALAHLGYRSPPPGLAKAASFSSQDRKSDLGAI